MLFIPLTLDVIWLGAMIIGAFLTGFLFRSGLIAKRDRKIAELEKEMVTSHAEILELQKEKLVLEEKIKKSSSIPVIPITEKKADNKSAGQK
jgi:hypothetical protein